MGFFVCIFFSILFTNSLTLSLADVDLPMPIDSLLMFLKALDFDAEDVITLVLFWRAGTMSEEDLSRDHLFGLFRHYK